MTSTQRAERSITRIFRQRDALMDAACQTGEWSRVEALEADARREQSRLARLVEQTDPPRAARLRAMANN